MRERGFRPEVGDGEHFFQRQRAGHDFPVNRAQRVVGHRPRIQFAQAVQHGPLAVRCVNLLARFELDFADGQHVFGALVQQPDDVRVQAVDRLAMFGYVHNQWRMPNYK